MERDINVSTFYVKCFTFAGLKIQVLSTNLTKIPNMKFHENSPRSLAVQCG